jgi:uncharacterized damage-inducible protein DinB
MRSIVPLSLVLLWSVAATLPAQEPAAAPSANPLRAEYLAAFDDVAGKLRQLAEAIPEDKYGWRPAEGVRSVGELFGHVAGGNYLLLKMAGVAPPADVPADLEKLASKADVVNWLGRSLDHARTAAEGATAEDLAQKVDFFGKETTGRGLYLLEYGHLSEHLGQAIAYARSIGVTPPWSR